MADHRHSRQSCCTISPSFVHNGLFLCLDQQFLSEAGSAHQDQKVDGGVAIGALAKTELGVIHGGLNGFGGTRPGEAFPVGQTLGQTASFRQTAPETWCQSRGCGVSRPASPKTVKHPVLPTLRCYSRRVSMRCAWTMFSQGDQAKTVNRPSCEATSATASCWSRTNCAAER